MRQLKNSILLSILLLYLPTAYAGGWLQGKKKGYFKLSQTAIIADQFYNGFGKKVDITTTSNYITSVYGEYGISNKFDAIAYVPLVSRLTLNDVRFSSGRFVKGDEYTSIGDAQIGLKYGLRQNKPLVISAAIILGLPIGNDAGGNTELLQTGDGEFNQMIRLDVGYSFSFPLYANIGMAFNNRTKNFSEEIIFDAEVGYEFNKKFLFALKFAGVESLMNGDPKGSSGAGIFSNNLEYLSFGSEVAYTFKEKWGLSASYRTASSGQFILAAPAYEIGLFLKIK